MKTDRFFKKAAFARAVSALLAVFFIFPAISNRATVSVGAVNLSSATTSEVGVDISVFTSAYLYNIENDFIVYSYEADDLVYPTSTVKIMTGILAIEALGDSLEDTVTVTSEMIEDATGNTIGFEEGETVTIEDLLYSLLVGGANDAAYILAYLVGGTVDNFISMMNARALELGATSTRYTNPSGVHDGGMVTTAADTAKIALAAYSLPLFMTISSTSSYVIPETNMNEYRTVYNRNYLITSSGNTYGYVYSGASGMNAGATTDGGYCVVTTAESDGLTYLAVVMGADASDDGTQIYSYETATTLLDYAFASYENITLVEEGEIICEIPVELSGSADYVTLVTSEELTVYLPSDTDLDVDIKRTYKTMTDSLEAPVYENQEAGSLTVTYKDEIIGNIPLVTTTAVSRSTFLYTLAQIESFATGRFFIIAVVSAAALTVIYVIGKAVYLGHKKKYRGRYK